ncbi:MAG: NADH-quinone oxidoreductase subunit L [Rickettsiales bacterium]|nr:NADH-quinone oxidoreductase subunit L [Pseudomonadota bacterium]MDA0966679.1 NADH-quinone oxidoreductase subunit L [Pseudomonadota bacterium]MDG4543707.1 NADH-quinone oxidoreductase subunit L [Rickettsiales bacterium]MDG4545854.1 NADH-quinone oxidoreductase subunit L [Rickettsiales bacterium]MDG4547372.1 NADH-quinone oxidoreductase subunit L [Rickettsiales bacterium]
MIAAIVFIPLLTAFYVGMMSRTISNKSAQLITCGGLLTSAFLSTILFYDVAIMGQAQVSDITRWIDSGTFSVSWSLRVDSLTAVMLVLVTWVSSIVHIYSVGYMSHDAHLPRFMAYLSLFTFFMLMLVTSDNFLQLFFGWEGVGLSSYLLIGFWYKKQSAKDAAMKAFIVNRVGDFGLILGIFAIYMIFGSLNFSEVFAKTDGYSDSVINIFGEQYNAITVICLLLFIGAMGKSAQLGLHTWLPDAMEGPTPVSALIHAATMVTAGVFLVARCSPLFEYSDFARDVVTIVGAATAIFAATIAITQNDIKRVIAYSTCSQLGYMFFACGVSAYSAGVFHLLTHGFFKALLFLGAGSVIHALSNEQDLRKMGGIWKKIPKTYTLMWIGSLALAGVFPFAGFYSKDMILESAYASGGMGGYAYWVGIAAAFLTAFYSWRLIIMAFHGKPRASKEVMSHVHESPSVMLIPLYVLAIGAMFSGALGYYILGIVDHDLAFWNGAITVFEHNNPLEDAHHVPLYIKLMPAIAGLLGIGLAYFIYMFNPVIAASLSEALSPVYKFLLNKWYIDELYNFLFVTPAKKIGSSLWKVGDTIIVDGGGPNGAAWIVRKLSGTVGKIQSGLVYHYALIMILGLFGLISWFVVKNIFGV